MYEAHFDEAEEVDRGFLVTSEQSATFLEPAHEPLDHVAAAVHGAVEIRVRPFGMVAAGGNDRWGGALAEPLANPVGGEMQVTAQVDRSDIEFPVVVGDPGVFQDRREGCGLVRLAGGHLGVQRMSLAVAEEVDLRRETAAGAAGGVVFRLARVFFFPPPPAQRWARTIVPSMHHSSWSNVSLSVIAALSRSTISSSVPSELHWLNQVYTVSQGPNSSSGKSRHSAPVRRIHKMPSTTCRRSDRGRPVLAGGGNTGATHSHCSSVRQCRAIPNSLLGASRIDDEGR